MESPPAGSSLPDPRLGGLEHSNWLTYGDAVRVLGTVAVVVGHVADMILFDEHAAPAAWWTANVVDCLSRWAVPAYVMLSGAILLSPYRAESMRVFYGKRLARLGVPIVFWTVFFALFSIYYTRWSDWPSTLRGLALGEPYAHLHFVYRIFGLYLLTPMLRVFIRHADRRLLGVTVMAVLIVSVGDSLVNGLTQTKPSVFARFVPFLGYYLAGYWLRDLNVTRRWLIGCWILALSCAGILIAWLGVSVRVLGWPLEAYPSVSMLMFDFLSPVRVVMSLCVWAILLRHLTHRPGSGPAGWTRAVKALAPATLGVYLIHPLFREVLHLHGITAAWPHVAVGIWLTPMMVYGLSLAATLVLLRLPGLRRIMG